MYNIEVYSFSNYCSSRCIISSTSCCGDFKLTKTFEAIKKISINIANNLIIDEVFMVAKYNINKAIYRNR